MCDTVIERHVEVMECYKSLAVWQNAHRLTVDVLRATDDARRQRTWAMFDQLRRAVISVEANIVEGYALNTPGLLCRHLRIAIGSLAEVECLVRTAGEMEYLDEERASQILTIVDETFPLLIGFYRSCHRRRRAS